MLPIGRSASGPVAQILIVQTWPGGVAGDHTDPMVIVPGTAPVENAPMVVVAVS